MGNTHAFYIVIQVQNAKISKVAQIQSPIILKLELICSRRFTVPRPMRALKGVLVGCAAAELSFYGWYQSKLSSANSAEPDCGQLLTLSERALLFSRCLAHPPAPGGVDGNRHFVRGWFGGDNLSSVSELSRQDIDQWLGWGLFGQRVSEMEDSTRVELQQLVSAVEEGTDTQFLLAPPEQPPTTGMRPSWEQLPAAHKPLLFYTAVALADAAAGIWLRYNGFQLRTCSAGQLEYWLRELDAPATAPSAVLFHGMGIGLLPYCTALVPALVGLLQNGRFSRVVLIRSPHVAMDIRKSDGAPPSRLQICAALEGIMGEGGKAILFGHSYGTFQLAQVCRHRPDLLYGLVMFDPMCFMLHLETTTNSFCYAHLRKEETSVIHQMIRSEMLMNICMRRHFNWYNNCLWLEDLQNAGLLGADGDDEQASKTFVVVAAKDENMPCQEVVQYLHSRDLAASSAGSSPRVMVLEDGDHGDVLSPAHTACVFSELDKWLTTIDINS